MPPSRKRRAHAVKPTGAAAASVVEVELTELRRQLAEALTELQRRGSYEQRDENAAMRLVVRLCGVLA